MQETFKPINGYEGLYEVSNMGRVKSLKNTKRRILKPGLSSDGYRMAVLYKNSKPKTWKIALLVWDTFGDKLRDGQRLQIDHIDENKLNDRIENLQLTNSHRNIGDHYQRMGRKLPTGVSQVGNKFRVAIQINKKYSSLGYYDTVDKASRVYQSALRGGVLSLTT